jgi:hypothetical protein
MKNQFGLFRQLAAVAVATSFPLWAGSVTPTPEPGTLALMGSAIVGLVVWARLRRRK